MSINVTLTASLNPSSYLQPVLFTVTVSQSLSGVIVFYTGLQQFGFAILTSPSPTVQFSSTLLPIGVNNVTVQYTPYGSQVTYTSNTLVQTVNAVGTNVVQATTPWIVAGAGTAGVSATGVETVQGIAGGTPVPISGTVSIGAGPFAVTQSTSPWVVSLASTTITGTVAVTQSTNPWVVSLSSTTITGTVAVTQSTSPWVVSNSGTFAVQDVDAEASLATLAATFTAGSPAYVQGTVSATQGTTPWIISGGGGTQYPSGTVVSPATGNVILGNYNGTVVAVNVDGPTSWANVLVTDDVAQDLLTQLLIETQLHTQYGTEGDNIVQIAGSDHAVLGSGPQTDGSRALNIRQVPSTYPFSASVGATATLVAIATTPGVPVVLDNFVIINNTAALAYVQIFDAAAITAVTVGTTKASWIIPVPGNSTTGAGVANAYLRGTAHYKGIVIACTTTRTGNSAATCDVLMWVN